MKSLLTVAMATSAVLMQTDPGSPQVRTAGYPLTELSDEDVARLDLRDGTVFDWLDPPYADGGEGCVSEQPAICAVEFMNLSQNRE
jgi:hypothetical protein